MLNLSLSLKRELMFKDNSETGLVDRQKLGLYLKPIFIAQLSLVDSLEHNAYAFNNGVFELVLEEDEIILPEFIREYALNIGSEIFINTEDDKLLKESISKELTVMARSLSIGDPLRNSVKQANLLTFQMNSLYDDPLNNALLSSQFQGGQSLSSLLTNTTGLDKRLYHRLGQIDHHYVLKQPMISSIMLLAFLKEIKAFSPRENENLFLTSYFKDIGMSFIPKDTWDQGSLSSFDKENLSKHSESSYEILDGRVPLSKKYLNIIKNHNYLNSKANKSESIDAIIGVETALVNAVDILVAMINERPYRSNYTVFKALDFLKILISDDYPQEYRALVKFVLKFLKQ